MLTFEQIKELIELVSERKLQGVEIERSGFRVKIDGKSASAVGTEVVMGQPVAVVDAPSSAVRIDSEAGAAGPGSGEATAEQEAAELDGLHLLQSPIVGTFYTSPSPDADPYVQVGDRVKKGQVLCIVEAMKLMNEIESDEDGVVEKVFPKNAEPVEYGEYLFAIRTD